MERITEEAVSGSKEAYAEIYELKRWELYRAALKRLGSPEDAEDAAQDTLICAFQHIGKLKHPRALNSWLYKILHQRCADILRRRNRQVITVMTDDDVADIVADENVDFLPEKRAEDDELRYELYEAIARLPEKCRETFIMYYLRDMKYGEIALLTNTSVKTVSTNLIRAKRKLRSQFSVAGAGLMGLFTTVALHNDE
ncbi:MAG: RNA polymerase sigma factor [Clostridiales Family XIII bacterium]|nr:RNA polymerase sigma factor [Clostridiales Family XIII bacterium]